MILNLFNRPTKIEFPKIAETFLFDELAYIEFTAQCNKLFTKEDTHKFECKQKINIELQSIIERIQTIFNEHKKNNI